MFQIQYSFRRRRRERSRSFSVEFIAMERESPRVRSTMELESLEVLLGIKYDQVRVNKGGVILSPDRWQCMTEALDKEGTTCLMAASADGSLPCVDFLVRCGAQVNVRDRRNRRAIDHSLMGGGGTDVALLLLQWDSLLPVHRDLDTLGEGILSFLAQRDAFHAELVHGTLERIEMLLLEGSRDSRTCPRYWVNSRGESALYTAGMGNKYDAWALLRASGFAYASPSERSEMCCFEDEDAFRFAIGKYFVPLEGCHIQKMVAKSRVYQCDWDGGSNGGEFGERVAEYYRELDGLRYSSDILKCLQDDETLEVVFDFSSTDIQGMHPLNKRCQVYGLMDFRFNRVYAAAKESEGFDRSDAISNLVHELAHKALDVLFENGGLPYRVGDVLVAEEYDHVVQQVLSDLRTQEVDRIIKRAAGSPALAPQELIVRVPEMAVKYSHRSVGCEDGFDRLREQVPRLLEFYEKYVVPAIKEYVSRNKSANMVARSLVRRCPELLSAYNDRRAVVVESFAKSDYETSRHNQLALMEVSNLTLGVSHLNSVFREDITVVDWSRFQGAIDYFSFAASRSEVKRLAIVWDEEYSVPFFCRSSTTCSDLRCVARKLDPFTHMSILVVRGNVPGRGAGKRLEYAWNDLSRITKDWVWDRVVDLGGYKAKLGCVVKGFSGCEGVESKLLGQLLGPDDISTLIDEENMRLGKPLESSDTARSGSCIIPRMLRVGRVEFDKEFFRKRTRDAFFVRNANETALEDAGIGRFFVWDGGVIPDGARCFILGEVHGQKDAAVAIMETMKNFSHSHGWSWNFIHFFTFVDGKFVHDHSVNYRLVWRSPLSGIRVESSGIDLMKPNDQPCNEAVVISDVPGSGKSVFMSETARVVKKKYPNCWVGLVELPFYEKIIKEWRESDMSSHESVVSVLYELMKAGNSMLERKVFGLFCQTKEKVFVFFDAFDEICPNYKQKVTTLLESLRRCTEVRICIATRTHESSELEDRLSTLAYSFVPFDRLQQVKFLDSEWNASLKSLPEGERIEKIRRIVASLQSHHGAGHAEDISALQRNLELHLKEGVGPRLKTVSFIPLAKKFIASGKLVTRDEGDFSETPLHAWMFASVAFEENFNFPDFLSQPQLYKRFVDLKIELYSREKAKAQECVAGDSMEALFKSTTYDLLKKFSAFFFLEEKVYRLKSQEMPHVLRIGVVVERSGSITFVHRTFGEYLFSLWLLEKAKRKRVTMVWLEQVLLEGKFEKVRQLLDSLLRSEYDRQLYGLGVSEWRWSPLNRAAFPLEMVGKIVPSVQKCLYTSIVERHEGILQYLVEFSADCTPEVIFGHPLWDVKALPINIPYFPGLKCKNAISVCGNCIKNDALVIRGNLCHLPLLTLRLILKLLQLVERLGLTPHLNQTVREDGLWWTGMNEQQLWRLKEGKTLFGAVFEYLARHGSAFPTAMEAVFDNEELVTNLATCAFDSLITLLDTIFKNKEFLEYLSRKDCFFLAWMGVVEKSGKEDVVKAWQYLLRKGLNSDGRKVFLHRKDQRHRSVMFAAFTNIAHPEVLPLIWSLCLTEMGDDKARSFALDSFSDVKDPFGTVPDSLFEWLHRLLGSQFLCEGDVARLLLSSDHSGKHHYLLSIHNYQAPSVAYWLQYLLYQSSGLRQVLLRIEGGHFSPLAPLCFPSTGLRRPRADAGQLFESLVTAKFSKLLPTLESLPFLERMEVDTQGNLLDVFHWNKGRVAAIGAKAYIVLLWQQISLLKGMLGKKGLVNLLHQEWYWVYHEFPELRVRSCDETGIDVLKKSDSFLISSFLGVISCFVSRSKLAQLLFHEDPSGRGTAFLWSLCQGDDRAFLLLYDLACWCVGEDALWRVHSCGGNGNQTVLEALQSSKLFLHL